MRHVERIDAVPLTPAGVVGQVAGIAFLGVLRKPPNSRELRDVRIDVSIEGAHCPLAGKSSDRASR